MKTGGAARRPWQRLSASLALLLAAWLPLLSQPALAQPNAADASAWLRWVLHSSDAHGKPFVIVDKRQAHVHVFAADGRLLGQAPALLGLARGDLGAPGVGQLAPRDIPPAWRTTPSGRFESQPGRNLQGETVVWIDHSAGLAIHRLRPAAAAERRPQRLASSTPGDNRITLGCVVVSGAFYDAVLAPTLGRQRAVVYVLPDSSDGRGSLAELSASAQPPAAGRLAQLTR